MEVKSCGLEILAKISQSEMKRLANNILVGNLNYQDGKKRKDISFSLVTNVTQRELTEVSQEPSNCYLGDADKVTFSISQQFYELLFNRGSYGARFYGAVGKLEVEVLEQ